MANGIEFLLELNAKLDGATKMVRELSKVEAAVAKTDNALLKGEKQGSTFGRIVGGAGAKVEAFATQSMAHFAALASFEGLKQIGAALFNLGKEAVVAAGESQRVQMALENIVGKEFAEGYLDHIDKVAEHTEFTADTLEKFSLGLVRAGFRGEEYKRALAAVNDVAAMSEDKFEGASSAMGLLSKIQLKGAVSEKDLLGLGLNPDTFFKRLSGELGVGVKTVEERLQQGKVKVDTVLEAIYSSITEKTGTDLGGAGVGMSDGFLARLEKFKAIPGRIFGELDKNKGFQVLSDSLARVTALLDPINDKGVAGRKILDLLGSAFERVGNFINGIDFEKVFNTLSDGASRAMEVLAPFWPTFKNLVSIAWDYGVVMARVLAPAFLLVLEAVKAVMPILEAVTGLMAKGAGLVSRYLGAAQDQALVAGQGATAGFLEGMHGKIGEVAQATHQIGDAAVMGIQQSLDSHSPSRVFEEIGRFTAEGFMLGLEKSVPEVRGSVDYAFSPAAIAPSVGAGAAEAAAVGVSLGAAPAGAAGAGGGVHLEANITVNLGSAGESARATGEEIGQGIRAQLVRLIEQMQAEGAGA